MAKDDESPDFPSKDRATAPAEPTPLTGTTLKVYRLIYREGRPLGVGEVQKQLKLSSPSVAHYHIAKLLQSGLVRDTGHGYVVDKVIFEGMLRFRRSLVPVQTTFAIFFFTTLIGLVTILRPDKISAIFVFALAINLVALGIFVYQTIYSLRKTA